MGLFLFSLAMIDIAKKMKSNLNVWYLDDGKIASNIQTALANYLEILKFNLKCELQLIKPQSAECKDALESFLTYWLIKPP